MRVGGFWIAPHLLSRWVSWRFLQFQSTLVVYAFCRNWCWISTTCDYHFSDVFGWWCRNWKRLFSSRFIPRLERSTNFVVDAEFKWNRGISIAFQVQFSLLLWRKLGLITGWHVCCFNFRNHIPTASLLFWLYFIKFNGSLRQKMTS